MTKTKVVTKNRKYINMLRIVCRHEVAERKPYRFSYEAMKKMEMRKKEREVKRIKIASSLEKINSLVEAM